MSQKAQQVYGLVVADRSLMASFSVEYHTPPVAFAGLHGRDIEVQASTTCVLATTDEQRAVGVTHCAARERFRYTRGCQYALDRALVMAVTEGALFGDPDVESAYGGSWLALLRAAHGQVLPELAADYAAKLKRSQPNELRALRREVSDLRETLRLLGFVAEYGITLTRLVMLRDFINLGMAVEPPEEGV